MTAASPSGKLNPSEHVTIRAAIPFVGIPASSLTKRTRFHCRPHYNCMKINLSSSKINLLGYFNPWTLSKGEDYYKRRKVQKHWRAALDEVHGSVSGSGGRTYLTRLYLDDFGCDLHATDCSCPMEEDCKHTAALYIAHLSELDEEVVQESHKELVRSLLMLESETKPAAQESGTRHLKVVPNDDQAAPPSRPRPAVLPPLPGEIQRSFQMFASMLKQSDADKPEDFAPTEKKTKKTELIYVLRKDHWRDEPNIEVNSVSILKDGSFGKTNTVKLERLLGNNPPACAHPGDIEIARFWTAVSRSGYNYWSSDLSLSSADPRLVALLISNILETGRCFFESPNSPPLRLGPELPGALAWEAYGETQFRLATVARDGEHQYLCLRCSSHLWYVDQAGGRCGPVKAAFDNKLLRPILSMRALTREETQSVPVLLCDLGLSHIVPPPPVPAPVEIRMIKPAPVLELKHPRTAVPLNWDNQSIAAAGDKVRAVVVSNTVPGVRPPYVDQSGTTVVEKPDRAAIEEMHLKLTTLGFGEASRLAFREEDTSKRFFVACHPDAWINLDADKITALRAQGWQISPEAEAALSPLELDDAELNFEIAGEDNWWFSLALNIEINGKAVPLLPLLIAAIRGLKKSESIGDSIDTLNRNGKFIGCLPDGTPISLPFERIRSILVSIKELIEKGLDPNKKMPVVDAADMLADETLSRARFLRADKIKRLVDGLKALKQIEPVAEPKQFGTELRPYQKEGLSWLQFMAHYEFGGILADDMGLGKTVQLLAHICLEKEAGRMQQPFLVICPTSVLPNWVSEAAKFAPQLNVVPFHGQDRFASVAKMKDADLVISTYPLLARDLETFDKLNWHGVVLDEAQAIKNYTTKLAQAARSLKSGHKFCLTGTPIENHLGELWSQFQFLLPGLLGDAATFKNVFRDPIEKLGSIEQKKVLAGRVKPFILRRTKKEVTQELPDKTEIVQMVELEGSQRDLYETVRLATTKQVRDEIAKKGFKHSQIMILDALLKMRQVCCEPQLVKLTAASKVTTSAKLDMLIEMLEQLTADGRKILIFSQFTSMLGLIENRLATCGLEYVKLTGDTKDRSRPVKEFQEGSVPIFLISLKAGGTGLNLTAADVVIHYDPWWNPAVEDQATDRAHRIGQTKKIFVYKLIARGTIEQRMVDLQERKRAIASSIYDEQGNTSLKFSESDLDALLRPIDEDVQS